MIGAWVLIFIQVSQNFPGVGDLKVTGQPIYFHTKAACDSVALEFNRGPEPSKDAPGKSFGAVCRATGDTKEVAK